MKASRDLAVGGPHSGAYGIAVFLCRVHCADRLPPTGAMIKTHRGLSRKPICSASPITTTTTIVCDLFWTLYKDNNGETRR